MNNKLIQRGNIGTEIKLHDLRFCRESHQVTVPTVIRVKVHDLADSVRQESLGFDDFEVVAHAVPVEPLYQAVQCFCGRIGVREIEVGEHAFTPVLRRGQELREHALEAGGQACSPQIVTGLGVLAVPCIVDVVEVLFGGVSIGQNGPVLEKGIHAQAGEVSDLMAVPAEDAIGLSQPLSVSDVLARPGQIHTQPVKGFVGHAHDMELIHDDRHVSQSSPDRLEVWSPHVDGHDLDLRLKRQGVDGMEDRLPASCWQDVYDCAFLDIAEGGSQFSGEHGFVYTQDPQRGGNDRRQSLFQGLGEDRSDGLGIQPDQSTNFSERQAGRQFLDVRCQPGGGFPVLQDAGHFLHERFSALPAAITLQQDFDRDGSIKLGQVSAQPLANPEIVRVGSFADRAGVSLGNGRRLDAISPAMLCCSACFPAVKIEEVHRHDVNRLMEVKS